MPMCNTRSAIACSSSGRSASRYVRAASLKSCLITFSSDCSVAALAGRALGSCVAVGSDCSLPSTKSPCKRLRDGPSERASPNNRSRARSRKKYSIQTSVTPINYLIVSSCWGRGQGPLFEKRPLGHAQVPAGRWRIFVLVAPKRAGRNFCMPEFRLIQISDTHLARRHQSLTDNFHRVSEYIDTRRPDLVVNSGDVGWDGPTSRGDLEFARELHASLPVACRYLPGNHDIGDNPTAVGSPPAQPVTEANRQAFIDIFGEDRWRFEAAGWCFIGLNSLVMNTGLASEAEQFDWLAPPLAASHGQPGGAVV